MKNVYGRERKEGRLKQIHKRRKEWKTPENEREGKDGKDGKSIYVNKNGRMKQGGCIGVKGVWCRCLKHVERDNWVHRNT